MNNDDLGGQIDRQAHDISDLPPATFYTALSKSLQDALEEATKWVSLVKVSEDPIAFNLNDVVQLCLLNYRVNSTREIPVKTIVSKHTAVHGTVVYSDPPMISGIYFALLETTVSNLIANVMKHSGLGRRARIEIELIDARRRITVICRNSLSAPRARTAAMRAKIFEKELRGSVSDRAGQDKGSGLSKVRRMWIKHLKNAPRILLDVNERSRRIHNDHSREAQSWVSLRNQLRY